MAFDGGRAFDDFSTARVNVYDQFKSAASQMKPFEHAGRRMEIVDVDYDQADADDDTTDKYGYSAQSLAVRERQTLGRRLRGTIRMTDVATGEVLDERRSLLAVVPRVNEDGTLIYRGSRYNVINQQRMKPAVFGRVKQNAELESFVNPKPGTGSMHRYIFNPETSVFYVNAGNSRIPLVPLLRTLGVSDEEIRSSWGDEIANKNFEKKAPQAIDKLYEKLVPGDLKSKETPNEEYKKMAIRQAIAKLEVDPWSMKKNLGEDGDRLSPTAILKTTAKVLKMARGEEKSDDRDHLAFQTIHAIEDLLAERVRLDSGGEQGKAARRALYRRNLGALPPKFLQGQIESTIFGSGLGVQPEYANPLDAWDRATRITKMGDGGISSTDAVPKESRDYHVSHGGFIDPARSVESLKVGVDLNVASKLVKGKDGKVYTPVINARTGKMEHLSSEEFSEKNVAFSSKEDIPGYVQVNRQGREDFVKPDEVDYILPHAESSFSSLANLVPMKTLQPQNRTAMGSRFLSQSLPLVNREAPLVRSAVPGTDKTKSFDELYSDRVGVQRAQVAGKVVAVTPDNIVIQGADGKKSKVNLHANTPLGRKTSLRNTARVKVGDAVEPGQLLATSNFSDDDGTLAVGLNARMAIMPWGDNYEDAYTVSESFAKRMASLHSYDYRREASADSKTSLNDFVSAIPRAYTKSQLENVDENGVIKVGSKVSHGDPLVLSAKARSVNKAKKLARSGHNAFMDASQTWDHEDPGTVTNVHTDKRGNVVVTVDTEAPMRDGDKLCYAEGTEILTSEGWVDVADLTLDHEVATLIDGVRFDYINPAKINQYDHDGDMYRLETSQVSLLVTGNHNLYAANRDLKPLKGSVKTSEFDTSPFGLVPATKLFGKRYRMKRDGVWVGSGPSHLIFESETYDCGERNLVSGRQRSYRYADEKSIPIMDACWLMGAFLATGSIVTTKSSGTYCITFSQPRQDLVKKFEGRLAKSQLPFSCRYRDGQFRIYGHQLLQWFESFMTSNGPRIPNFVFKWPVEAQREIVRWMLWRFEDGGNTRFMTTSRGLADDFQRLLLHVGWSGNVSVIEGGDHRIKGIATQVQDVHVVSVYKSKQYPTINHSHVKKQSAQVERWEHYQGKVYCPSMPYGHVVYVRRDGKPVWCGNSEMFGSKGIVRIIPDDQMVKDSQGRPFEVVSSDLGFISRKNSSRALSLMLGKIAEKTGKPYFLEEDEPGVELADFVASELKKHGVSDLEEVEDPVSGRKIKGVLAGPQFMMKLQHTAESKSHGRGTGAYASDGTPAKGSEEGMQAKRLSNQELGALVSHGAWEYLRDAALVRGQRNDEYVARFINGHDAPPPKVPMVYQKFLGYLQGMGVNPVRTGTKTRLMLMGDKDVEELTEGRTVSSGETINIAKDMEPIKGGLFDPKIFGEGDKFAKFELAEPLPHPLMEDLFRNLMGVTKDNYRKILSGEQSFGQFGSGATGIAAWAKSFDAKKELGLAMNQTQSASKTKRAEAIKKVRFLKGLVDREMSPEDLLVRSVPIIPPKFRPVSKLAGKDTPLIDGMNLLYRDMIAADENLRKVGRFSSDTSKERLALYDSVQAAVGLRQPLDPELRQKKVQGIMQRITGNSPKTSMIQSKLLGGTVDSVGRAVIGPDAKLRLDEVGIPEEQAWKVFEMPVLRNLAKRGIPLSEAKKAITDRSEVARKALLSEMRERPVTVSRAPVLHKFGKMAFMPKLVKGTTVHMNPLVYAGYGADNDGDAVNFHAMISDEAVKEAKEKLLPSKSLLSPEDFKTPMFVPRQDHALGVFLASTLRDKKARPVKFASRRAAMLAFQNGKINADTPVEIVGED